MYTCCVMIWSKLTHRMPIKPESKKTEVETGTNVTGRFVLLCLMKWLWSFSLCGMRRLEQ